MKPINEYRHTSTWLVGSFEAQDMGAIWANFGRDIVSVGHDPREHKRHEYTVRLCSAVLGLVDVKVDVFTTTQISRVNIIDREVIREPWATPAQRKAASDAQSCAL